MVFSKINFSLAKPVYIKDHEKEMNRAVIFKSTVKKGNSTSIRITAQNDYQLFINDVFVFHGPARAGHGFFRVDEINIEKYLTMDENTVKVLVLGYHCNNFYLVNQQAFLCAELYDNGICFCPTGTDSWSAHLYEQKLQKVQRYAFQRTFCEAYDFTERAPLELGCEAQQITYEIDTFIKRDTAYPSFPYEDKICFYECGNVSKSDTPTHFNPWWYYNIGKGYSGFLPSDIQLSSTDIIDNITLTKSENQEISDTLDANTYASAMMRANLTGFVSLKVDCICDTTLALTFDEILLDNKINFARMECANVIIYKLKGGQSYNLITAEPYTFKYMNVISLGGSVKINSLGMIKAEFNESEIIKKVKDTADDQIKRIFDAAKETFKQNTFDIYMDCPSRERAGWLCDSFFTSRVEYFMTGKSTVERAFLANFVMNPQYEPVPKGMLPMCYPADHTDGNFIPNWAMWYVLELDEYLKRTGDYDFAYSIKDNLYRLLSFFKSCENKNGLLEKLKGWVFVEWSECNNLCQDINYPTNMLYYKFKKTLARLYDDKSLDSEAEALKAQINKEARLGLFYCDNAVYDENGVAKLSGKITETCQYYAFFTGVCTREEDKELWDTLVKDFGPDRRTNNKWEHVYFSNAFIGNYLRLELLKEAGIKDALESNIRSYFDYMAKSTGTLWENDTPSASCNHGFASSVLIWLDYLGYTEDK